MKYIAILLLFFVSTSASAGLLDSLATSDFKTKEVTSQYKIDTYGYNVRVYEWKPKDNEDVRCVLVAGSENSTGVACYNVKNARD